MVEEMQNNVEVQQIEEGDRVKGTVTKVKEKHALIDFGYKIDAILPIGEISNVHIDKVGDVLKEGDEIEAVIIKLTEDEVVVSKRRAVSEQAWTELEEKYQSGEVFEVTVAEVVKGGLVVDVGLRGFIPASQVERHFVEDFSDYVGKLLRVKVIELDRDKNKVILSQRAVLEEEEAKAKEARLQQLEVGEELEGTVSRLTSFGAFVDIGGVDGLVHISEMAWHHVETPEEVVKEGDTVKVKVLKVDPEKQKVSLSIKAAQPSPWQKAADEIKAGDTVKGVVKRLAPFGAFVELLPGVEGLVHISQIANRRIGSPGEVLKEGQEVEAKVLDVNPEEERISLSIRELQDERRSEEVQAFTAKQNQSAGVTLGDLIGDQLKKLKQ
ncbi:small subunit ribosomal protein S1 [Caldalkalibacillus uzonensis]|uniref:Small subunit ribosomal protein S1 n=1 Tax=Caldalkalibacillus uzonensis TaxID=353224 RepID=A0ABU0CMX4_9BACI|nr:30S ribosomal protein S1 [Caldalkalibacillus uzonensis]MDQ0337761.1 small subunit ribosomal protein S1 [Caldalkalibacillus uzonensis]